MIQYKKHVILQQYIISASRYPYVLHYGGICLIWLEEVLLKTHKFHIILASVQNNFCTSCHETHQSWGTTRFSGPFIQDSLYWYYDNELTHWGRVTFINNMCISKLTTIGSDNGLMPGRCQAIIWTYVGILLIWILGTNLNEIHPFSFKKMLLKCCLRNSRHFASVSMC